ncbi:MAG: 3-demethylubiquinone-9 3-methyltransferase [Parcubacteria group bacterium Gr01-1014_13]|nr:MAG: 3-demethylubiquinone-9 3-methyltransferase [Parcubacteria group bacterium Gr01-1014_13]
MQKITPNLWYNKEAKEAAEFYVSVFPDSKINSLRTLRNTPSGDTDVVSFELLGYKFMSISAGPFFKFNPSVSFLVTCQSKEEVDNFWKKLSPGGKVMMELGEYPFSKHYGWTADKYGVSWQIMLADEHYQFKQKLTPTLMFVGENAGKAEEAMTFYASIFPDSKVGGIARYPAGMDPEKEGTVMHGAVVLAGQEFFAMDSAREHKFAFNEAISFIVNCDTQEEIDYFWEKLSAVPESEQCGWLKDKYGFSWQIVPNIMDEMMKDNDEEKLARVTEAFLKMKKFDIAKLKEAYEGK